MAKGPDPFDPTWVRGSLLVRAHRVAVGTDPNEERSRLFDELSGWAVSYADRQTRGLPSSADPHEVRSRSLIAVWEATRRIDWDRPTAWPSLLKRKLRGALLDAARSDDSLSRRDRVELRRLRAVVADWEIRHGRAATQLERRSLLDRHRDDGSRFYDRLEMLDRPLDFDSIPVELSGFGSDRSNPEAIVIELAQRASVKRWLEEVVPEPLAEQLTSWAHRDRAGAQLPNRLATRVDPYVGALANAVRDSPDASDANQSEPQLFGSTIPQMPWPREQDG